MAVLEVVLVLGLLGALVYGVSIALVQPGDRRPPAPSSGSWRVAHYDADGRTRVVLQRVSAAGDRVLDEHVVATVPCDDPAYDDRFLEAMDAARRRRAVFESEEGA